MQVFTLTQQLFGLHNLLGVQSSVRQVTVTSCSLMMRGASLSTTLANIHHTSYNKICTYIYSLMIFGLQIHEISFHICIFNIYPTRLSRVLVVYSGILVL